MSEPRPPSSSPSPPDGEGVRVVRKPPAARRRRVLVGGAALALAAVAVTWLVLAPGREHQRRPALPVAADGVPADHAAARSTPSTVQAVAQRGANDPVDGPSGTDPNDLAAYFRPGDPEPTGAELIEALHHVGIRTGIGAFNPPGTSPPLVGLAVPPDFDLPDGYVRHHQVTDEGVALEPILMFSPDFALYDRHGRPLAMPADRVVPPELAPPGLPLRRIRVPAR